MLERFRSYLLLLARRQLGDGADASDVVQQTMLEAHREREAFRGETDAERAAWLRRMLANNLLDRDRARHRLKRDASRELSLEQELEQSSAKLGALLASEQSSPSERAEKHEDALRLAAALAALPETQSEALVLQHWHGLTLAEIGERMGKTPVAVAGLLKRGLKTLREILEGRAQPGDG